MRRIHSSERWLHGPCATRLPYKRGTEVVPVRVQGRALRRAGHSRGSDGEEQQEGDEHQDGGADEGRPVAVEVPDQDPRDHRADGLGQRPHAGTQTGHLGGALGHDEVDQERNVQRRPHAVGEADEAHHHEGLGNRDDLRAGQGKEGERHKPDGEDRRLPDAVGDVTGGDRAEDRSEEGGKEELEGVTFARAELVDGEARQIREDAAGAEPEDSGGEDVLRQLALGEETAHVAPDVDPYSSFRSGRRFGLADSDGRDGERHYEDRGDQNEHELWRPIPEEKREERGGDLTEHVEDGEDGPDPAALSGRDEVGHQRGVWVDGNVEEERVDGEDDEHRRDRWEPREIKKGGRGERHTGDEEWLAPSDARPRPVRDRAHNWLRERACERTLLGEETHGPYRDLGIAVEIKTRGAVQEVVDGVRSEVAEAVDNGLAERERSCRAGWFHARRSSALALAERSKPLEEKVFPQTNKPCRTLVLTAAGADNRSAWMRSRCSRCWRRSRRSSGWPSCFAGPSTAAGLPFVRRSQRSFTPRCRRRPTRSSTRTGTVRASMRSCATPAGSCRSTLSSPTKPGTRSRKRRTRRTVARRSGRSCSRFVDTSMRWAGMFRRRMERSTLR